MDIKERVLLFAEYKGIKPSVLEKQLGISRSYFYNIKSISAEVLSKIVTTYPEVSADWLLTGQGEMLRQPSEPTEPSAWSSFISLVTDEVRRKMGDE